MDPGNEACRDNMAQEHHRPELTTHHDTVPCVRPKLAGVMNFSGSSDRYHSIEPRKSLSSNMKSVPFVKYRALNFWLQENLELCILSVLR